MIAAPYSETLFSPYAGGTAMTCKRTVRWEGEEATLEFKDHVFAYSGIMPCTGPRLCVHCGTNEADTPEILEELECEQSPQSLRRP